MDMSLREREQRAALFREVNERIASLAERALLPEIVPIEVTCECVDMSCTTGVQIPLHEFAEIHRTTNRFLVVPGHELPREGTSRNGWQPTADALLTMEFSGNRWQLVATVSPCLRALRVRSICR